MGYPSSLERLIKALQRLPGIGRRSAERIAFYILQASTEEIKYLSKSIEEAKNNLHFCQLCNNLTEKDLCSICDNPSRERNLICVVEEPKDLLAIEMTGSYKGLYYVLGGCIAPLEGKGPEDLKIKPLLKRIKEENIQEIILAMGSDSEGEMTAHYLLDLLKGLNVNVSRIGIGIPAGTNIDYFDAVTLSKALEGRRQLISFPRSSAGRAGGC